MLSSFSRKNSENQQEVYQTQTYPYTQQYYNYYTEQYQQYYNYVTYFEDRAPLGIPYLDTYILKGGLRRGEVYLVAGEAGMGKTIFSLKFLKTGADYGEVGIYVTVDEPSEDVKVGVKQAVGWDLESYEMNGKLYILDLRTHFKIYAREGKVPIIDPRDLAKLIIDNVKKYGAKRLVIDPIAPLIITSHQDILWIREYMRELVFQLKKLKDVTTIITSEIPTGENKISRFGVEEYLAGGVIVLSLEEYNNQLYRIMFIRKMRWMPVRPIKLVFDIVPYEGIIVYGTLDQVLRQQQYYSQYSYPYVIQHYPPYPSYEYYQQYYYSGQYGQQSQ